MVVPTGLAVRLRFYFVIIFKAKSAASDKTSTTADRRLLALASEASAGGRLLRAAAKTNKAPSRRAMPNIHACEKRTSKASAPIRAARPVRWIRSKFKSFFQKQLSQGGRSFLVPHQYPVRWGAISANSCPISTALNTCSKTYQFGHRSRKLIAQAPLKVSRPGRSTSKDSELAQIEPVHRGHHASQHDARDRSDGGSH
jgi:hypothetical protein